MDLFRNRKKKKDDGGDSDGHSHQQALAGFSDHGSLTASEADGDSQRLVADEDPPATPTSILSASQNNLSDEAIPQGSVSTAASSNKGQLFDALIVDDSDEEATDIFDDNEDDDDNDDQVRSVSAGSEIMSASALTSQSLSPRSFKEVIDNISSHFSNMKIPAVVTHHSTASDPSHPAYHASSLRGGGGVGSGDDKEANDDHAGRHYAGGDAGGAHLPSSAISDQHSSLHSSRASLLGGGVAGEEAFGSEHSASRHSLNGGGSRQIDRGGHVVASVRVDGGDRDEEDDDYDDLDHSGSEGDGATPRRGGDEEDDEEDRSNVSENDDDNKTGTGSDSAEDYTDDEDEGSDGYKPGGYHPVTIGETYNQRCVLVCFRFALALLCFLSNVDSRHGSFHNAGTL